MTPHDLRRELAPAVRVALTAPVREGLRAAGVTRPPMIGVATVRAAGAVFEFADHGVEALILPVVETGELVDLVAVMVSNPARFRTRAGFAAVLGSHQIERARHAVKWRGDEAGPLPIHRDPLAWLRMDCGGAVILDDERAGFALAGVGAVVAEDREHAERLRATLYRPPPDVPRILVRVPGARHAA